MKRLLLFVAVSMITAISFAQEVATDKSQLTRMSVQQVQKWQGALTIPTFLTDKTSFSKVIATPTTRSSSTGVYYYKPEGSLYNCYYDTDPTSDTYGGYLYNTLIAVPTWQFFTFVNMSDDPTACSWAIGNYDYTEYADEDGSMTMYHGYPGYYYECPTLSNSTDSYMMGYYASNGYKSRMHAFNDLQWLSFVDNKDFYNWGALDNDNIAGTGTFTSDGETYICADVAAEYPAPASPLYVEDVYIVGSVIGSSTMPLNNGATLSMYIYNSQTGELLETLTATDNDTDWACWGTLERTTTTQIGVLRFSKKVDDALFGEMEEPFVIDCPTTVYLSDFEDCDINFAVLGYAVTDCDNTTSSSVGEEAGTWQSNRLYMILLGPDNNYYTMAYSGICMNAMFNGIMDKVVVAEEIIFDDDTAVDSCNVLVVSDDGKSCSVYGAPSTSYDLGGAFVETVSSWYNENGNDNYSLDVMPDWVTDIFVDTQYYDVDNSSYYNIVSFTTEALPAGVTGRAAKVWLTGRGYTAETPIYIIQGDATPDDAIEYTDVESIKTIAPVKNSATYNLTGQRVGGATKGLLIKDGKKILVK